MFVMMTAGDSAWVTYREAGALSECRDQEWEYKQHLKLKAKFEPGS